MDGFQIEVRAGADVASSSVTASGRERHIITDEEVATFGLSNDALKDSIQASFGARPTDVYLRSPTPWGDLYKKYNWGETATIICVKSATVTEITAEPVIVARRVFTNSATIAATFDASVSDQVSNTVESNWSISNKITVQQTFKYNISFLGAGGGGSTSFAYEHAWGEGGSETKQVTVGSTSGVSVLLEPGQSVEAQLSATRGVMKVQIVYEAYLEGTIAANYSSPYQGHHFWPFATEMHPPSGGSTRREYTEDIKVGYYSNARIELRDQAGRLKTAIPVDVIAS